MMIPTDGTVIAVKRRMGRDYWMVHVRKDSDGRDYILTGMKPRPNVKKGQHVEKGQEI